jgi:hypothetical protein
VNITYFISSPLLEAIAIPYNCFEVETFDQVRLIHRITVTAVTVVKKRQVFREESGDLDELKFIQNKAPKLIFG